MIHDPKPVNTMAVSGGLSGRQLKTVDSIRIDASSSGRSSSSFGLANTISFRAGASYGTAKDIQAAESAQAAYLDEIKKEKEQEAKV